MDFMTQMKNTAINSVEFNGAVTENGAVGYASTGKKLLDLNFAVASLRHASDAEIADRFMDAYYENPELAVTWLFYARDARSGLGERRLFRVAFKALLNARVLSCKQIKSLLSITAEYGRWDDLYAVADLEEEIISDIFKAQLSEDCKNMKEGKPVSLLAKWLKSEKASSVESRALAAWTMEHLSLTPKEYRKTLSALRKYIDVTEVKMCANKWSEIDYSKVPSKASLNYRDAFTEHDGERYAAYIERVNAGTEKINAGTLYPHEIVGQYVSGSWGEAVSSKVNDTLEALWKNLPDTVNGNGTTMVVADGSGSMTVRCAGNYSALTVANALAIYFAERAAGPYKDKYITFSYNPKFVDFSNCETLRAKIATALKHDEVADTNIEKVFDLILKTAVENKLSQEDIPTNILIISDMEFNCACDERVDRSLFDGIAAKYAAYDYKLPRLVFWNVNSRTGVIPVTQNDAGVALVSGFSVNIAKMVLSGELDPFKCLLNVLLSDRYNAVRDALKN